jgi:DNA/RNA endonuclease G (NUC1)
MCRFWAEKEDGLYVVCGPIVTNKSPKTIGRKQKVVVPDAFFKVILSTSGKQPRALGFIFENKNNVYHITHSITIFHLYYTIQNLSCQ